MVSISADDKMMVTISCGLSKFNIVGTSSEDFPEMPRVEKLKSFTIAQQNLKTMINMTVFAVSTNENKPVHTGSLFEVSPQELTMVSVDGYRMALCREKIEEKVKARIYPLWFRGKRFERWKRFPGKPMRS